MESFWEQSRFRRGRDAASVLPMLLVFSFMLAQRLGILVPAPGDLSCDACQDKGWNVSEGPASPRLHVALNKYATYGM